MHFPIDRRAAVLLPDGSEYRDKLGCLEIGFEQSSNTVRVDQSRSCRCRDCRERLVLRGEPYQ